MDILFKSIIFLMGALVLVGIVGFYIVRLIIMLWYRCGDKEAESKIDDFMNRRKRYFFNKDMIFINDVWCRIKAIIGERRYNELIQLCQTGVVLLFFGYNSGLPYIAICINYKDDNEKVLLEAVLSDLVKQYLAIVGYDMRILVDWKYNVDLNMPFIEIRYATTRNEVAILVRALSIVRQDITDRNLDIVDDTELEDLYV